MVPELKNRLHVRKAESTDPIPYDLLLLADPSMTAIEKYLPASEIYVCELDEVCIGVYVLYPAGNGIAEIKNIAVKDELQGKGIGKHLLADACTRAKNAGYDRIIIGTGNSSIGQLFLYQQQGFEIFGMKMNFFMENYDEPIFEDGIQCKHMIMLGKDLPAGSRE